MRFTKIVREVSLIGLRGGGNYLFKSFLVANELALYPANVLSDELNIFSETFSSNNVYFVGQRTVRIQGSVMPFKQNMAAFSQFNTVFTNNSFIQLPIANQNGEETVDSEY